MTLPSWKCGAGKRGVPNPWSVPSEESYGFPSGRISGEIARISNPQRGIDPAVATKGWYKCGRPIIIKPLKSYIFPNLAQNLSLSAILAKIRKFNQYISHNICLSTHKPTGANLVDVGGSS